MGMVGKVVVFLLVGSSSAQVWDKELCKARESHWTHNNHGYLYSGRSSLLAAEEVLSLVLVLVIVYPGHCYRRKQPRQGLVRPTLQQ